jgi:hypothetical protein
MEENQITNTTKMLMLGVAMFFDASQFVINFLPVLGQVLSIFIGIFAQMTFWLWFKIKGVSYNSSKRLAAFATGFIVGLVPILDALPELTLEVAMILGTLEAEKKIATKVPGGAMLTNLARQGAATHPEVKSLKQNFSNLKSDRDRERTNLKKAA